MLLTVTALPPILDIAAPKGEGTGSANAFAPLIAALTVAPADGKALPPPGQPMPVAASGDATPQVLAPTDAMKSLAPLDPPGTVRKQGAATPIPRSATLQLPPATMAPVAAGTTMPANLPVRHGPAQSLQSPGQPVRALLDDDDLDLADKTAPDQPGGSSATATPDPSRAIASVAPSGLALPAPPALSPAGAAAPPRMERLTVAPLSSPGRTGAATTPSEQAHEHDVADEENGLAGHPTSDAALLTLPPNLQSVPTVDQAVRMSAGRFTTMPATTPAAPFTATADAVSPAIARSVATTTTTGTLDATIMAAADGEAGARSGSSPAPQPRPMGTDPASPALTSVAAPPGLPPLPTKSVAVADTRPTAAMAGPPALPTAAPLAPSPTPVIVPALQAFGAAMRQVLADERRPARRVAEPAGIAPTLPATATATTTTIATAAPLDTADARWPQAMVEHIERLRDAADAASTRVRLLPDALGPVDVTVRRDGDAIHVHLAAPSAETRQLLQDAQPRLAEAAEQRGVKLVRAEVSAGFSDASGGGDRQPPRTPAPFIRAPRPAPAPAAAADADGTRIA